MLEQIWLSKGRKRFTNQVPYLYFLPPNVNHDVVYLLFLPISTDIHNVWRGEVPHNARKDSSTF